MTSPRPPRILVVDDEPQIRRFLRASLPQQGYALVEAATGAEAQAQFAREKPDLVILDLGLPDCDGLDVLAHIRAHGLTPVLVLSAREDVAGKVIALEAGADDYVTKPFDMAELVARLKAALRHGIQTAGAEPVFRAGALMLDLVHRKVEVSGQDVKLTPKEYDVLCFLARHAGKVVTHHQVLREVWGPAHAEDVQYLRVLIRQLRRKIEADASNPQLLLTEPGVGYRLIAPG
jgi:two-component system KDP operon response regulator KdpE